MSPSEAPSRYDAPAREALLALAREAIRAALDGEPARGTDGLPAAVDPAALPAALLEPGAAFVTLQREGELRGCIGSLTPRRALASDVAANARAAAFDDPRFPPLARWELADLEIHLAIVGPAEPLVVGSERELLAALRPGIDGLILEAGIYRATFLPAVWENLPDPRDFVAHLKRKAGLPADAWGPDFTFSRYTVEAIG